MADADASAVSERPGGSAPPDRANAPDRSNASEGVAAYKRILQEILVNRPSGTRQRLASALGKNRSFISQITLAAYPVPIPQRHLATIFEICHMPEEERQRFLAAYYRAHPRHAEGSDAVPMRSHTITLPDLGDPQRNRQLDALVTEFVTGLARVFEGARSDSPDDS